MNDKSTRLPAPGAALLSMTHCWATHTGTIGAMVSVACARRTRVMKSLCNILAAKRMLLACLSMVLALNAKGEDIINVNRYSPWDGPITFNDTIQEGVDDAGSGDTILIYENTSSSSYPGDITINKQVALKRNSDGTPVRIGRSSNSCLLYGVVYKPEDNWIATPGFESFFNNVGNLSEEKIRYVMLAPVWMPPKEQVKYVFLFSSGQQEFVQRGNQGPTEGGGPQITTGALDGWADNFPASSKSVYRYISKFSIASWLIEEAPNHDYGPHNTLLILAFKGGLQGPQEPIGDWFNSTDRKNIIAGYYAYLTNNANFQNVEIVYLCGISRGGALVSRLGKRIRKEHAEPEIFISTIDGHVNLDTQEMLSTATTVQNPLTHDLWTPDRFALFTLIKDYYMLLGPDENAGNPPFVYNPSLTNRLYVFNTVTSVKNRVINAPFRTYCSGPSSKEANQNFTNHWGFYSQRWVNYDHQDICENWHWDVGPKHVEWFLDNAFP